MNIFDIIGPVMTGPSSSHTAGAVRIAALARGIFGSKIDHAHITLYNSFATTGKGHGTDKAIISGLLGLAPDDERIIDAYSLAKEKDLKIQIIWEHEQRSDLHPNTVSIILSNETSKRQITGISLGGGRVRIINIDGYKTDFSGEHHTLITAHKDMPGVVAGISSLLAENNVNIAYLRLYREHRGEEVMVLETDNPMPDDILTKVRELPYIITASVVVRSDI